MQARTRKLNFLQIQDQNNLGEPDRQVHDVPDQPFVVNVSSDTEDEGTRSSNTKVFWFSL